MLKCVGARRKHGEMTDETGRTINWDGIRFSCTNDSAPETIGLHVEVIKISRTDFVKVTGEKYENFPNFVDQVIDCNYFLDDGKPKLASFRIVKPENKPAQSK